MPTEKPNNQQPAIQGNRPKSIWTRVRNVVAAIALFCLVGGGLLPSPMAFGQSTAPEPYSPVKSNVSNRRLMEPWFLTYAGPTLTRAYETNKAAMTRLATALGKYADAHTNFLPTKLEQLAGTDPEFFQNFDFMKFTRLTQKPLVRTSDGSPRPFLYSGFDSNGLAVIFWTDCHFEFRKGPPASRDLAELQAKESRHPNPDWEAISNPREEWDFKFWISCVKDPEPEAKRSKWNYIILVIPGIWLVLQLVSRITPLVARKFGEKVDEAAPSRGLGANPIPSSGRSGCPSSGKTNCRYQFLRKNWRWLLFTIVMACTAFIIFAFNQPNPGFYIHLLICTVIFGLIALVTLIYAAFPPRLHEHVTCVLLGVTTIAVTIGSAFVAHFAWSEWTTDKEEILVPIIVFGAMVFVGCAVLIWRYFIIQIRCVRHQRKAKNVPNTTATR